MADEIRFVIITGLSGAGKSYAVKCFEDMGYFCVDNLPTTLIPTFAELCAQSTREIRRVALVVDIREGEYLEHLMENLQALKLKGFTPEILFLDASDESLVRRYHETRRRHPLAGSGSVLDGIRLERQRLAHLREMADRAIDTSHINVHQLKDLLVENYGQRGERQPLVLNLISFGYKHGVPYDADMVFDVRFLPNPFFVPAFRPMDGRHQAVREFILKHDESQVFLKHLRTFFAFLLPLYRREGKAYLTIALGCTGGRHRSVALVEELRAFFEGEGFPPIVTHRDVDRE
jgi:UPF0042 nucleotide-binding protein